MTTKPEPKGKCELCGEAFAKKRFWQKFCCKKHQLEWNVANRAKELSDLKEEVRILKLALQKAESRNATTD